MIRTPKIATYFEMIPDPRNCRQEHKLVDLITIALLSKICGASGWEDMTDFCTERREWLGSFLELPGGVPSPDTFRRVISAIQPDAFLAAFLEWTASLSNTPSKLVAIDGKTLKGTDVNGKPLHIVTAWCEENRLILGQLRNESKSNEAKTISELLKWLTLPEGCIVTIDAAGTQRGIASDIRDLKADYVLCVKGNQPNLKDEIENFFVQAEEAGSGYIALQQNLEENKGHGRIEQRKVSISSDIDWLPQKADWRDLQSIVKLESVRWSGEKKEEEVRYFITSLPPDPVVVARAIRGHWSVENDCHRVLDVVFREDDRSISEGHAPENLRTIEMLAAKMLKAEKSSKRGLKGKQFKAALNTNYLYRVLNASNF
jgi:predicted transposase YbfD/YdcC